MLLPSALVAGLSAATAFVTMGLIRAVGVDLPLLRLAIIAVPTGIVWLASLRALSHPLFDEIMLFAGKLGLPLARTSTQAEAG